jgi:glycerophosphoryl diester phosphodiesterase
MNKPFLKIGHRGAAGYEPENTLRSFSKALELGVDMVEFDIQKCATGELVVIHDHTVHRTTDGKGKVSELSFEELQKLDAGKGEKIPTLQEVLDLVNKRAAINIELIDQVSAANVAACIRKNIAENGWKNDNFLVSSFYHKELKKFKTIFPEIKIGALMEGVPVDDAKFAEELDANSVNMSVESIDAEFIQDAHRRGIKVFAYTADNADTISDMKNLGVNGLFSNFPDRL